MHTLRRLRLGRRARAQRQACRVGLGTLLESSPPLRFLTWPAVKSSDSASDWIGPCADAHSCTADRPCTKHCGAPVPSSPPAFATSERAPAPLALRPPGWPPPCAAAGHAPGRSACARAAPQHRRTAQTRRCARRRATHGLLTTAAPSLHWSAGYLALHSHNPDSRPAAPGGARGAPEHDWQAALGAINGGASRDARVVQVQGGGRRGRGRCGTQHARRHARPAAAAAVAVLRPRQQALPRRAVPG